MSSRSGLRPVWVFVYMQNMLLAYMFKSAFIFCVCACVYLEVPLRFSSSLTAVAWLLSDIYKQLMNMDGQWDGTDVCPLRGDERRMCSLSWEINSARLTGMQRDLWTEKRASIGVSVAGSGQMVTFRYLIWVLQVNQFHYNFHIKKIIQVLNNLLIFMVFFWSISEFCFF